MRTTDPRSHRRRRKQSSRGSALLVSLMVMVGLSLLGLSFVAISETENAISVNERNKTQTAALAEAGAKVVVQWFQNPDDMNTKGLLPTNDDDFKLLRTVVAYSGFYKPDNAGELLFDTPFGPTQSDMFYGDEERADIRIIDKANADSTAFIEAFNNNLFFNTDAGRVTEIRVYAPPIVGGSQVNGFWVGGQRYGVATIAVTAKKTNPAGVVIAQSVCRIILAPFPLPGPGGAIQAGGGIATNGSYEVHWGAVESEDTGNTFIKRESTSLPRFDAYDHVYFEYGLDSSKVWLPGRRFAATPDASKEYLGEVVRPTTAAIAAVREYVAAETRAPTHSTDPDLADEPAWNTSNFWDGDVRWVERKPTTYPVAPSTGPSPYQRHSWLYEMLQRTVDDPWFHVRTRGRVDGKEYGLGPAGQPHAYNYATLADANMAIAGNFTTGGQNRSHYFQYQTYNDRPDYKEVSIPKFDYDFWKAAAIAGRGQPGVYYFQHAGGGKFTDGVTTQTFEDWIEDKQGFLFFDSNNNLNPQNGGGTLVAGGADPCGAKGVIYMNFEMIKTTGCDGVDGWYNQPGEPFRDSGFRKVNEVSSGVNLQGEFTTDAAGTAIYDGGYNGKWNYQDLAWSNGGVAKNGIFDVCVRQRNVIRESTNAQTTFWLPLPYFPGCKVGNNISMPTCECSEPFEPYLNIDYTGVTVGLQAQWEDPTSANSVYAKTRTDPKNPATGPIACAASAVSTKQGQEDCATNAFDNRGALAFIQKFAGGAAIGVEGVLYNEGKYESTGNAAYYGAVVVQGLVSPNGTQEIWFDECLTKECWPPEHIPFPRVLITSTQIQ